MKKKTSKNNNPEISKYIIDDKIWTKKGPVEFSNKDEGTGILDDEPDSGTDTEFWPSRFTSILIHLFDNDYHYFRTRERKTKRGSNRKRPQKTPYDPGLKISTLCKFAGEDAGKDPLKKLSLFPLLNWMIEKKIVSTLNLKLETYYVITDKGKTLHGIIQSPNMDYLLNNLENSDDLVFILFELLKSEI